MGKNREIHGWKWSVRIACIFSRKSVFFVHFICMREGRDLRVQSAFPVPADDVIWLDRVSTRFAYLSTLFHVYSPPQTWKSKGVAFTFVCVCVCVCVSAFRSHSQRIRSRHRPRDDDASVKDRTAWNRDLSLILRRPMGSFWLMEILICIHTHVLVLLLIAAFRPKPA